MGVEPLRVAGALALLLGVLSGAPAGGAATQTQPPHVETLKPVAALPAHIAGSFRSLTACQQAADGTYFIFDRRAHAVYTLAPGADAAQKLIQIGAEPGRLLDPTAFRLAGDGTFAVADAPHGPPRIQIFTSSGSSLRAFYLEGRNVPRITLKDLVLSGVAAMEYTGSSVFLSQPEQGALVVEYGADGRAIRSFGELRTTGHEAEAGVHLALNSGLVVSHPAGGVYFVFLSGVPQFRRYDAAGRLMFERHIEGSELDHFIQNLPTRWKRQRTEEGETPLVLPTIYAAAADHAGNLWVSLAVGISYVYDAAGNKRRAVRFQAAGAISPISLSFTHQRRVLVTPGCYAFPAD